MAGRPRSVDDEIASVCFKVARQGSLKGLAAAARGASCGDQDRGSMPAGPAAERAYLTYLRNMADDCAAGAGGVLRCLSTEQTVRDRDAIRAAPSERTTNLLGVSYGTRLGAACAARSPYRTGRMVLDSVGGPWDWSDFDVLQSRGTAAPR